MSHAEKTTVDPRPILALPVLALALLAPDAAQARESDRDQAVDMSASGLETALAQDGDTRLTDLVITQGTLRIEAVRGTVTRTNGDFSRIVLEGTPATMQQENDDGVPMKAQAQRIVYLPRADVVTLTGQVAIDQGQDSFRGESVTYDIGTGRMKADGGTGRIQMTIQPRKKSPSGDGD